MSDNDGNAIFMGGSVKTIGKYLLTDRTSMNPGRVDSGHCTKSQQLVDQYIAIQLQGTALKQPWEPLKCYFNGPPTNQQTNQQPETWMHEWKHMLIQFLTVQAMHIHIF